MNTIKEFTHPNIGTRLDMKFVFISAVLLIAGGLLIYASLNYETSHVNLPSIMIGTGICSIIMGIVCYIVKGRALYFLTTESKIEYKALHFDADALPALKQLANTGRITEVEKLQPKEIGNVRLEIMKAADNCFAAIQVYQYIDLAYVAQTEVRTLNISEVEDLLKHIKNA